jgi:serine kinase of HPr protein (carbohydrate metabolism regulator)
MLKINVTFVILSIQIVIPEEVQKAPKHVGEKVLINTSFYCICAFCWCIKKIMNKCTEWKASRHGKLVRIATLGAKI